MKGNYRAAQLVEFLDDVARVCDQHEAWTAALLGWASGRYISQYGHDSFRKLIPELAEITDKATP